MAFHQALVRRKYRRLFSSTSCARKSGPKGPDQALIQAIVELKSRNPRFGCPRIGGIISQTFGIDVDKNVVYHVLSKHYRPAPGGDGPSWLSFIGHTTDKAKRGELRGPLPVGFVYSPQDTVVLDPDAQVQRVLRLFFDTYRRTGSMLATVKEFRAQDIAFPRRLKRGPASRRAGVGPAAAQSGPPDHS